MSTSTTLLWFRRDLRLQDNPALAAALQRGRVLPLYILDDVNAGDWSMGAAGRWWLHHSLDSLNHSLDHKLWVMAGDPLQIIPRLIAEQGIDAVYWNRCYEPWQMQRDRRLKQRLREQNLAVESFNASLLWEPWASLKQDGTPYRVFTPFWRNGMANLAVPAPAGLDRNRLELSACPQSANKLAQLRLMPEIEWYENISLHWNPGEESAQARLRSFLESGITNYKDGRDYPASNSVSRLSPFLHFGEISPRQVWHDVREIGAAAGVEQQAAHFQRELAWREFSYSLLYHFPRLPEQNMNPRFDNFPWVTDRELLRRWQLGQTGYPIIDAGMRELWNTGYMHNRVRMVVASFLVKNLLIHWQAGARWFRDCLVDADIANNSCGWQWVAGCGADAAPYFRIFNPVTQSRKFDAGGSYIRRFVPELERVPAKYIHDPQTAPAPVLRQAGVVLDKDYPAPIADLKETRKRALSAYRSLREQASQESG